jgi:hypothetical protein
MCGQGKDHGCTQIDDVSRNQPVGLSNKEEHTLLVLSGGIL